MNKRWPSFKSDGIISERSSDRISEVGPAVIGFKDGKNILTTRGDLGR